jgi:hypothetical protein
LKIVFRRPPGDVPGGRDVHEGEKVVALIKLIKLLVRWFNYGAALCVVLMMGLTGAEVVDRLFGIQFLEPMRWWDCPGR